MALAGINGRGDTRTIAGGVIIAGAVIAITMAALLLGGTRAAAQSLSEGFDHEGLARQMMEKHIKPGFERFQLTTKKLQTTIDAACKSRASTDFGAVTAAFRDVVIAWSQVEHLRFGPAIANNRYERIVFWPDRQRIGRRQVRKILKKRDPKVLTQAGLQKKSVAVQGLTALEVLLFGKKSGELLKDSELGRFSCGYALAIAGNLSGIAQEIVTAWSKADAFVHLWLKTGSQNTLYKDSNGPTYEMLKAYKFGLKNVRDGKLIGPLGLRRSGPGGSFLKKTRPSFGLSGLSISVVVANTLGVLNLFEKGGFAERLMENEEGSVDLIKLELNSVIHLAAPIEKLGPGAFKDKDATKRLISMGFPLKSALIAGGEALERETGMVLGFSDDDGD